MQSSTGKTIQQNSRKESFSSYLTRQVTVFKE